MLLVKCAPAALHDSGVARPLPSATMQSRETRAALETLAEAEAEMESVHFEKKQLLAQWKSSLLAIQK